MDLKTDLSITLTAEEWDRVLDILGNGPFKTVSPLIKKILDQAQARERQQASDEGQREYPKLINDGDQ